MSHYTCTQIIQAMKNAADHKEELVSMDTESERTEESSDSVGSEASLVAMETSTTELEGPPQTSANGFLNKEKGN